jgi:hypothetical protein
MALRIVVGFLTQMTLGRAGTADAHLARLIRLRDRADAHGGRLCALGSQSLAFDFAPDDLEEALAFALTEHHDAPRGTDAALWGVGIAQGEMEPVVDAGSLVLPSWGVPLVVAIGLARTARPGEVLIDPDLPAVQAGDVLTWGTRISKDGPLRVRGSIVDPRGVFRRDAAAHLTQLGRPPLIGRAELLRAAVQGKAQLLLLRADAGYGGTRLLEEIESTLMPARSLYMCTAGAEPLGALRRAFSAALVAHGARAAQAFDAHLHGALERLLAGDGVPLPLAAELVSAWITTPGLSTPNRERSHGVVLIDDAMDIDDPSLDAVALAVASSSGSVRALARIEQGASVPTPLASLALGEQLSLAPLSSSEAEQLGNALTTGQLSGDAAKRWARRGRFIPLAVIEAVAEAITSGELSSLAGGLVPRTRGTDAALEARAWISRRLVFLPPPARRVLNAVAALGAEVPTRLVLELLAALELRGEAEPTAYLTATGWLRVTREGFCVLPSRTHRQVILEALGDDERTQIHSCASQLVAKTGGKMAQVEAARHAALAGEQVRAIELARSAARAALAIGLENAADALLAFADTTREDLGAEPVARPLCIDSWLDALRSSSQGGAATKRVEAIAALARGDLRNALVTLRQAVRDEQQSPPPARSRSWLALAVGLGVAGRPSEALFAALEALARARESGETAGEEACVRFLAKLSLACGYPEAALRWQTARAEPR